MPIWPDNLPDFSPLLASLRITPQSNVIAFGTEVGPGKLRRRTTARVTAYTGSFYLTDAERLTFLDFFRDDLLDGALSFTLYEPVDGVGEFRFDPSSPYSLAPLTTEQWQITVSLVRLS